jgi:hypothetical protein
MLIFNLLWNEKLVIMKILVDDNKDWNYSYSYAIIKNNDKISCRIADCIIKFSRKNNLNPRIVTRKIWKETKFKQHEYSYKDKIVTNNGIIKTNRIIIAYGLSQIHLKKHDVRLYYVFNKKYAKRLHEDPDFKYKMIFFIGVNIKLGTDILSEYRERFNGDYYAGLTAYWAGPGSDEFDDFKNGITNQYALDIMSGTNYDNKMITFNNWKFIERKKPAYIYMNKKISFSINNIYEEEQTLQSTNSRRGQTLKTSRKIYRHK